MRATLLQLTTQSNQLSWKKRMGSCIMYQISYPKLGQIEHVGGVVRSSGTADSKSSFENWPRFMGVIEQNKIQQTYCHHCISYHYL